MRAPLISEDIFPIGEFKKHASRLFCRVSQEKRPIVVTQNGLPVGVIVPPEEYDRMSQRADFVEAVAAGLRDAEAGRVLSSEEVEEKLDRSFGHLTHAKKR